MSELFEIECGGDQRRFGKLAATALGAAALALASVPAWAEGERQAQQADASAQAAEAGKTNQSAAGAGSDEGAASLPDVVVTAASIGRQPLAMTIDPKRAIQPIPAADGAGLLKVVPGVSLLRKGGAGGEAMFRGLGASRLPIVTDGATIFGGCGGRMDPPTGYVFPFAYDTVEVVKGPQIVSKGPGAVAGAVTFERNRDKPRPESPTFGAAALATFGSYGRVDLNGGAVGATKYAYSRLGVNFNRSDDYKDGDGNKYHSAYKRGMFSAAVGLTPMDRSYIELGYERGWGWNAYADRGMDGTAFDRDEYSVRAQLGLPNDVVRDVGASWTLNKIDHDMDNFSHREVVPNKMGKKMFMLGNPKRDVHNAKAYVDLSYKDKVDGQIGVDYYYDEHAGRGGSGPSAEAAKAARKAAKYKWDSKIDNFGVYGESSIGLTERSRLALGARYDHRVSKYNEDRAKAAKRDLSKIEVTHNTGSGYARFEQDVGPVTFFAGLGAGSRAPDWWERNRKHGENLDAETNYEADLGLTFQSSRVNGSLTAYASRVKNFILLDYVKGEARNVDANRYGFDGEVEVTLTPNWKIGATGSYAYGQNDTDDRPLPQTAPAEGTLSVTYSRDRFSATALGRAVAKQTRLAVGEGTITGADKFESESFATLSANVSARLTKNISLAAGVDNIFDKDYSEFLNRAGAEIEGSNPSNGMPIKEPGRTFWVSLQGKF